MEDIEKFLLEQLENAIEELEPFGTTSSVFQECGSLKELIEKRKDNTGAAVEAKRRENLYYLLNIVAEWRAVLEKHNQCSPAAQIALNGQLTERLKKIKKDLESPSVQVAAQSLDKEKPAKKPRGLENPYRLDLSKIWGINDKCKVMERLLVRKEINGFRAIGIVGMAGVGKTTFCQVALNNEQVKKHFLLRIWVEMSEQPIEAENYKKEVVKSFLRSLGFEDKGMKESDLSLLLLALRKQLQGKRYLVVLDDVWHLDTRFKEFCSALAEEDGNKDRLSYGLPKGSGGCVIVTSRSETWAVEMAGKNNLQRLTPLEDKKSIWKIFKQPIEEKGYWVDDELKKTKGEVVKRCAGLPLIAKMLGETYLKTYLQDKEKPKGPEEPTRN